MTEQETETKFSAKKMNERRENKFSSGSKLVSDARDYSFRFTTPRPATEHFIIICNRAIQSLPTSCL